VLRLFPGREVPALVKLIEVDEVVGIRALCPALRGLLELVGKDADGERDGVFLASKKSALFSQ
jgi:hypothetical protein